MTVILHIFILYFGIFNTTGISRLKNGTVIFFLHASVWMGRLVGRSVFLIDINSTPHYIVTLHVLHNLSFSFTINFTFNNHKNIVEIHYEEDNNILTSSLIINNIYIYSLRSIYLSTYLSFVVKRHCKYLKSTHLTNFTKICK